MAAARTREISGVRVYQDGVSAGFDENVLEVDGGDSYTAM